MKTDFNKVVFTEKSCVKLDGPVIQRRQQAGGNIIYKQEFMVISLLDHVKLMKGQS